ncbi:MAG: hypothetical protein RIQ89_251 [Bacteroidota bacterium]|jgi:outer membrane receptor protein involved in Fe transport
MYKTVIFFLIASHFLVSTERVQAQTNKANGNFRSGPAIGAISGKIFEEASKTPIPFAAVALLQAKDSSVVVGALTDERGGFIFSELPYGNFILKISAIGFKDYANGKITLKPGSELVDLGSIKLNKMVMQLKEANVVGDKSDFVQGVDRKIYNVDKNITNTGGTATEVLQNIPSVTVDIDGNLALRGSGNVTVLIDGKPSALTGATRQAILQQIPASAIDQVEVITNPGAKYDAEGMAGIINIKTKKEKLQGLNANITAGMGTNNKYNLALGFNKRNAKVNLFTNYAFRYEDRFGNGRGEQHLFLPDTNYYYINNNSNINSSYFHSLKSGIDWYLSARQTFGLSATITTRFEQRPENLVFTFNDKDLNIIAASDRQTANKEAVDNLDLNFDHKFNFTEKSEWNNALTVSLNKRSVENVFINDIENYINLPYQRQFNSGQSLLITAQSDYSYKYAPSIKLDYGVKLTTRYNDAAINADRFSLIQQAYINDQNITDRFVYDERVPASYFQLSNEVHQLKFVAGIRAEYSYIKGTSSSLNTTNVNKYISLFPSMAMRYDWNNNTEFQLTYSRRINRPGQQQLNPFVDYSDTLNLRKGNPFLKPEFIQSFEVGINKRIKELTINATVYYRFTNNLLSRFRNVDANGVATMQPVNFETSQNIGLEAIFRYQLGKLGNVMLSFNGFNNTVSAANLIPELQATNRSWNGRANVNLRIAKPLMVQFTGMYAAKQRNPNSIINGMMNGVDLGLKYDFWKNAGSLSFNLTDVFDTKEFRVNNFGPTFNFLGYRKRETRIANLTFAYRWGKAEQINRKRQERRQGSEQMEMDF